MIRTIINYTDNKVMLNDAEVFDTFKTLQPNFYTLEYDIHRQFKNFKKNEMPKVFSLMPCDEFNNLDDYINTFLSKDYEDLCLKTNMLYKSGVLLYGKPGYGKSNFVNYIISKTIKNKNACVFSLNTILDIENIMNLSKDLRLLQNNLFVFIFEELDQIIRDSSYAEGLLKNFMDGINSINNCLFIGTTNYIDNIPKALCERPYRFRKSYKIEASSNLEENKKWIKEIITKFNSNLSEKESEDLCEKCLNKSIDEIKHTIIDFCLNIKDININKKLGF